MTIDVNTVLIGILMALSSWTLYTVHGLAKDAAAAAMKDQAQDGALREDRARIMQVEEDVAGLQVDVATLKSHRR